MRVLVTRKTTRLDSIGEYVRRRVTEGALDAEHLQRMKTGHKEHLETFMHLEETLKKHNIDYVEVSRDSYWPTTSKYDAIITVGGDGTVLDASHHVDNDTVPIIGIKSSRQSYGRLCCCSCKDIEILVSKLKNHTLKFDEVKRLQAQITSLESHSTSLTSPILNDALFCNLNPAASTRYKITVNELTESHQSSGVWISTAAGSSAAISAAGGAQVEITEDKYQYLVRELFQTTNGKRNILKGFFDAHKPSLQIENHCDDAALFLDGHYNLYKLRYGDVITFKRGISLKLVTSLEE